MSSSRPVAIIGAAGQLGSDLVRQAVAAGIDHVALNHADVDVTNPDAVAAALRSIAPRIVINSAAFHQVDRCEDDPRQAFEVNALGALHVARAARDSGATCVFISTDYVFDGGHRPGTAYKESEPVGPLNVYGASKAAGEQLVALTLENHLIARVSSLFGVAGARGKGGNFIETILKKAREGGELRVVNDQWMTPTYTEDAARAILALAADGTRGIVHVSNPESCTWHAFASEAVALTGLRAPVEPVSASTFASKVRRPRNSALGTERLAQALGGSLRPWQTALRAYLTAKGYLN